jgi:hypothetical protein
MSTLKVPHGVGSPNQSAQSVRMVRIRLKQPHPVEDSHSLLMVFQDMIEGERGGRHLAGASSAFRLSIAMR